jgi:hypothetical protein
VNFAEKYIELDIGKVENVWKKQIIADLLTTSTIGNVRLVCGV